MNPDSEPPQFVHMPAPRLSVPQEPEHMFPVRHTDWVRIRARIAKVSDPRPILNNVAWTVFGVAVSTALAIPPWLAAYDDLAADVRRQYFWVTVVLVAAAICTLLIAVVCWITSRLLRRAAEVTIESITEEMDTVYLPHRRAGDGSR